MNAKDTKFFLLVSGSLLIASMLLGPVAAERGVSPGIIALISVGTGVLWGLSAPRTKDR